MREKPAKAPSERLSYDVVLKDLFQRDRPSLLSTLTKGVAVRESLNVELALVKERRADLFLLLVDDTIFHLDFQSENDAEILYRTGVYGILGAQKYKRKIHQVVIYMGEPKMTMPGYLDIGDIKVACLLIDIREFGAAELLRSSRPGDYPLALLARGGRGKLKEILAKVGRLPEPKRSRVLTQLVVLSGLRRMAGDVRMEMKNMGLAVDIRKNPYLREIEDNGRAEGRVEGQALLLEKMLVSKFGPLPKWVHSRVNCGTEEQLERWSGKLFRAVTLEDVIGKR